MRHHATALTAIVLILLAGCTSRIHVPYSAAPETTPVAQQRSNLPVFSYQREPVVVQSQDMENHETDLYRVRRLRIPSVGDNGQKDNLIHAVYYQSKLPGEKKLVVVLPIWGSYTYPSRKITAGIRNRSRGDTNVLRILGENYILDWEALGNARSEEAFIEMLERNLERERHSVIDISRLVDWAEQQRDLDAARVGVVGFSHSTITAALVAINDPRVAATVLVMGSAHPHLIMATCDGRVADLREKIQARFGWSQEKYLSAMEVAFRPYDPAAYPGRADPRRVLFIDSQKDECMPQEGRDALWETFDRPERISFRYGHKKSFLAMTPLGFNWMRHRIYRFLDEALELPGAPPQLYQAASY